MYIFLPHLCELVVHRSVDEGRLAHPGLPQHHHVAPGGLGLLLRRRRRRREQQVRRRSPRERARGVTLDTHDGRAESEREGEAGTVFFLLLLLFFDSRKKKSSSESVSHASSANALSKVARVGGD